MPTAFLDSFQLIVAFYLFYVSIKGSGQMYRFFDISEEEDVYKRQSSGHVQFPDGADRHRADFLLVNLLCRPVPDGLTDP